MVFLKKNWQILNKNPSQLELLSKTFDLPKPLLQILVNRGLTTAQQIKAFLEPGLELLCPLEEIPQIKTAAAYILECIKTKKKITVYGDYDVDGVTSTALLVLALKELGAQNIDHYIPHRFSEGYGLNKAALQELKNKNTEVIITVDCGISNYEEVHFANELGLKVVITDHHLPPVVLPKAEFIVNPKLNNNPFDGRELAGVGVAFKFVEQLFRLQGHSPYQKSKKYLDLVVLGTIADIVPLLGENRILAVLGLEQLNKHPRVGLKALAEIAGIAKATTKDIGYALAPRLNAAGRMEHAGLSLELLLTDDRQEARRLAQQLNELNIKRQNIGIDIIEEVKLAIQKLATAAQEKVFILSARHWHPGIIGIVASQIVKIYNRPTILIAAGPQEGRGSIRSFEGLNIYEPLSRCAYLLKDFGGHKEAAGFEIESSKIREFMAAYKKIIDETIKPEDLLPVLNIETELKKSDFSMSLAEKLQNLAPFGQSNAVPLFSTKELSIIDFSRVGDGSHLKLTLSDGVNQLGGIAFGLGKLYDFLMHGKKFELAFNLEINEWNGSRKLQLNIKDIRGI